MDVGWLEEKKWVSACAGGPTGQASFVCAVAAAGGFVKGDAGFVVEGRGMARWLVLVVFEVQQCELSVGSFF